MNKINKYLLSGLAAAVLASIYSNGALAADANVTASAEVLAPLAIAQTIPMDFGQVAGSATAATTVVLDTANTTTPSGGAFADATATSAAFNVTGEDGLTYTILLPDDTTVTIDDGAGGGTPMTVTAFNDNLGGTNAAPSTPTVASATSPNFTVGATLNIGINQTAGTYSGPYTVTVEYQ